MFGQLASTFILLGSIANYKPVNNLRQTETHSADIQTNNNLLYGSYCWRDSWEETLDYYYEDVLEESSTTREYIFSDYSTYPENAYSVSFYRGGDETRDLYLQKITIRCSDDPEECFITFYTYDVYLAQFPTFTESIYWNTEDIDDLNYPNLIIYVRDSRYLNDDFIKGFNALFSRNSNSHTFIYDGYYNFTSLSPLTSDKIFVTGSLIFNNSLWLGFDNAGISSLRFHYYDVDTQAYSGIVYQYPFSRNQGLATSTNLLLSGSMMSNDTYSYLSQVGVFSYVRDNSFDNTTFGDLLFSVMDTPIYFITRLLSFELFGVNMFVAFTGLLTVCVILVLIRKFF